MDYIPKKKNDYDYNKEIPFNLLEDFKDHEYINVYKEDRFFLCPYCQNFHPISKTYEEKYPFLIWCNLAKKYYFIDKKSSELLIGKIVL